MRDNLWLEQRLSQIWGLLFPEIGKLNKVNIRFKGKWKNKFGHIKLLKNRDTEIAINSLFKDQRIPEYIIDLTIAHELVHYAHGFSSPHPRKHKHPHAGGIVTRELKQRGFGHLFALERQFTKRNWPAIYKEHQHLRRRSQNSLFFFLR